MEILKIGDKAVYNGSVAIIIDRDYEEGIEYLTTYKIEVYTVCQKRFWVHNSSLRTLDTLSGEYK